MIGVEVEGGGEVEVGETIGEDVIGEMEDGTQDKIMNTNNLMNVSNSNEYVIIILYINILS